MALETSCVQSFPFELEAAHRSAFIKAGDRNREISISLYQQNFPVLVVDERLCAVSLQAAVRTLRREF